MHVILIAIEMHTNLLWIFFGPDQTDRIRPHHRYKFWTGLD